MVSIFNAKDNSWNIFNGVEGFYNPIEKLEDLCSIIPEERIGSESTMGEVYRWKGIAVKVMPINSDLSYDINAKEIEIAILLSDLVRGKTSKYFPIVFGDKFCYKTFFYNHTNSLYMKQSKIYQDKKDIASHLLFSQLAYTDLKNYLEKYPSLPFEELNEIILQVLKGIRDMQINYNIIHNDLHLGNILVLNNPQKSKLQLLIHDFGKSIKVLPSKTLSNIQRKKDVIIFSSAIRNVKNKEINSKLDEMLNVLNSSVTNFPILDAINFWKNS